jgi:hypothetical protein
MSLQSEWLSPRKQMSTNAGEDAREKKPSNNVETRG